MNLNNSASVVRTLSIFNLFLLFQIKMYLGGGLENKKMWVTFKMRDLLKKLCFLFCPFFNEGRVGAVSNSKHKLFNVCKIQKNENK